MNRFHVAPGSLKHEILQFAKRIVYRSRWLNFLSRPYYAESLEPATLAFLVNAIDETRPLGGSIVEIGVARGMTSVFLNEHMRAREDSRRYLCIDTFSGFTEADVAYEVTHRGKTRGFYSGFSYNSPDIFRRNLSRYPNVEVLQKDANFVTKDDTGPIAVALIDVDLYLPIKNALSAIYEALIPGGYIVVDDVSKDGTIYDGARAAYLEFCRERGMPVEIICTNGGVVRKGSPASKGPSLVGQDSQ